MVGFQLLMITCLPVSSVMMFLGILAELMTLPGTAVSSPAVSLATTTRYWVRSVLVVTAGLISSKKILRRYQLACFFLPAMGVRPVSPPSLS